MRELLVQINYLKTNLTQLELLFVWAIIFVSVDGFPLLPLNNENRPLATVILLIYWGVQKIKSRSIPLFEIWLWLGYSVLFVFTLAKGVFEYHDYKASIKFAITGALAVITIATCRHFIKGLLERFSKEDVIRVITYSLILSSIVPIVVGFIQILALQGIIPTIFAEISTNFFSYRPLLDRPQLITTEASHAATYILIVLFWVYSFYNENDRFLKFYLAILFLLLLFISSSIGYVSFISTIIFYWLICSKIKFHRLFSYSWVIVSALVAIYFLQIFFINEYTFTRFIIIGDLISNLNMDTIVFWLQYDYSFLDRFGTPLLGFLSLKDTFFAGAGGESFYYLFPQLMAKYFPDMLSNPVLDGRLIEDAHFTVKFLPAKIASEFGLWGFSLFIWYILHTFRKLNSYQLKTDSHLYKGLCLCFIYTLISTYMCSYFNFIVILVFMVSTFIYANDTDRVALENPSNNPF